MEYPWFELLGKTDDLQQGDLINNCPILIPPNIINEGESINVEVTLLDSVILSQSCDLVNGKIEIVLISPYYPLFEWLKGLQDQSKKSRDRALDNLRKGNLPGYHLLNKSKEVGIDDYQVVDFRNVYGINFKLLKNKASLLESRVRVLSPYREHLSQAFARYLMRVGLPQDIQIEGY